MLATAHNLHFGSAGAPRAPWDTFLKMLLLLLPLLLLLQLLSLLLSLSLLKLLGRRKRAKPTVRVVLSISIRSITN